MNDKELILRDHLALERTRLANERTLFAYIRTSLYLLTAGIGILQIQSISRLDGLAWVCVVSGIILFFFGFVRFWQMRKHLKGYREE
ncbi:putative membrane protein [Bacteroides faecichinchillae]|uniref:Putative membrane protein n=2 Tax=Bacteroides faecichinchillae TaxID=871325 RepID=A0A1M4VNV2_9BACE|nr:putative membrane protein [Bacteroides faecichinchillae]